MDPAPHRTAPTGAPLPLDAPLLMDFVDVAALTSWSAGVFLAPLVTALPPYHRATWWLWPAIRVAWQLGGGMLAGAATARLVGAGPGGMATGAALLGTIGALLCVAPLVAMARGPTRLEGALWGVEGSSRTRWVPQAPAQRVQEVRLELRTADGPLRLTFRGMQGSHVRRRLAELTPGTDVVLTVLGPLRALVDVQARTAP